MIKQDSKVAVVTGASSGIGLIVARELCRRGWRVIALGRDPERSQHAVTAIRQAVPDAKLDFVLADLSVMENVLGAVDDIRALTSRVDLLVNNAGGTPAQFRMTSDGLEHTFAVNHLAPFLMTRELLPLIEAAVPGAQIINVSSVAHRFIKDMNWNDLQFEQHFNAGAVYSQSKLANILFTRALAKRLATDGMSVNAMHPGFVQTNFSSHGNRLVKLIYKVIRPFRFSLTPEQGADTILWLAEQSKPGTGGYFVKRALAETTAAAQSDAAAERLWSVSEALLASILGPSEAARAQAIG